MSRKVEEMKTRISREFMVFDMISIIPVAFSSYAKEPDCNKSIIGYFWSLLVCKPGWTSAFRCSMFGYRHQNVGHKQHARGPSFLRRILW